VNGLNNLDSDSQYVFMANHESGFDIFLVFAALPYKLVFMAKTELKKLPFMGWAMQLGKHIFVNRKNHLAAIASMDEARVSLNKYPRSIMIFPEGTRSLDGNLRTFKKGGVVLAIQTQLSIVPMAIKGTFNIAKKGSFILRPQPICLEIGKSINVSPYTIEDRVKLTETVFNEVENLRST